MPEPSVRMFCRGSLCIAHQAVCGRARCLAAMLLVLLWQPTEAIHDGFAEFVEAAWWGGLFTGAVAAAYNLYSGAPTNRRKV